MYLSQIAKCICLKLQSVFASNCKVYLSWIANVFISNCKMYLSQIANVFVSIYKVYLSQIAKCICLKLQSVFVSICKYICPKLLNNIFVEWKVATSSDVQEEEEMHQGSATISWLHKIAKNSKKNGHWFVFPLFSCARTLMMYIESGKMMWGQLSCWSQMSCKSTDATFQMQLGPFFVPYPICLHRDVFGEFFATPQTPTLSRAFLSTLQCLEFAHQMSLNFKVCCNIGFGRHWHFCQLN